MATFIKAFAVLAAVALAVEDPDVLVLTDDNFDSIVNPAEIILVEFYAPWCGHCKHLAPEYAKAATTLKKDDPPIPLAKVDATVAAGLGRRFNIDGYPTLKVFRSGEASDYKGPREADGIINYMRKQASAAAKEISSREELDKFTSSNKDEVSVVGFFTDKNNNHAKVFASFANSARDDYRFAVSIEPTRKTEEIVVYRPFSEDPTVSFNTVNGKFTLDEIKSFIDSAAVPLAGVYNTNVAKRYKKPRVTVFARADPVADAKQIVYYLNRLRKVAKDFPTLHFVLADQIEQSEDYNGLNYGEDAKWGLAIFDGENKYKYEGSDNFTSDLVKNFVTDYVGGKVEQYLKSEPVPAQATVDGLTTLVGRNFDQIVNDPTKDVLIEFYAPWCGHCKSLAPKYKQLAAELKDVDSLVIAQMDATANDVPSSFSVRGFPTIMFIKANDKKNPIAYDSEREAKPMKKWLKEKASIKF